MPMGSMLTRVHRLGLVFMTLGFGLFINLDMERSWGKIIGYQTIAGIGVGPLFQAPLIALQISIPRSDQAVATATFGFIRNFACAVSVVVGGVVFQNEMQKKNISLSASLGPEIAGKLTGGSAGANVLLIGQLPAAQRVIARAAYFQSLRTMWIAYVAFSALGLFFCLFIAANVLSKEHEVTKTGLAEEEKKRLETQGKNRMSKDVLRDEKRASKEAMKVDAADNRRKAGEALPKEEV